ncbi:MAG: BMP family ABC transporter substrate-binding protein [Metamycoplasmataceae bacterium]
MKNKKMLLGLGVSAVFSAGILATTISCSSNPDAPNPQNPLISGVDALSKEYNQKIIDNISSFKAQPTRLITAGGRVSDLSFNQSVYEGMLILQKQIRTILPDNHNFISYTETLDDGGLLNAYNDALNSGQKVWVLTGFQQANHIEQFLTDKNNVDKFIKDKIKIISVDWSVDTTKESSLKKLYDAGLIITLNFKTQEPSYVMGYALSKYLTSSFANEADWTVNSFGGGILPGVSLFNNGLLAGMDAFNKETTTTKKIKFVSGQGQSGTPNDTIIMDSGFNPSATVAISTIAASINSKAKTFFPVAGSLTNELLTKLNKDQLIVGVDSNQALAIPSRKDAFFTSIEKKVGVAVYESLIKILFPNVKGILNSINAIDNFSEGKTSIQANGGYAEGWVGTSLNVGPNAELINNLLNEAKDKFFPAGSTKPVIPAEGLVGFDETKNKQILDGYIKAINTR